MESSDSPSGGLFVCLLGQAINQNAINFMKNKYTPLVIALVFVGVFLYKGFFQKTEDNFSKKAKCATYGELVNEKIKGSGRVFQNDMYWVNEVFYSPARETCVYTFTIHPMSGQDIYNVYDLFGGEILVTSIDNLYSGKVIELKKD